MQPFGPLFDRQPFTLKLKVVISTRIVSLLFQCGPSTIRRPSLLLTLITVAARVMTIGVNSVYAKFVTFARLRSQVGKKVLKVVPPMIADCDTAPAPVFIAGRARIHTAIDHAYPTMPFWCASHAMFRVGSISSFLTQATAAICVMSHQAGSGGYAVLTTFAAAEPKRLIILVFPYIAKYSQATNYHARQIFDLIVGDRHDGRQILRIEGAARVIRKILLGSSSRNCLNAYSMTVNKSRRFAFDDAAIGMGEAGNRCGLSTSALANAIGVQQSMLGYPGGIIFQIVGKIGRRCRMVHVVSPFATIGLIRGRVLSTLPGISIGCYRCIVAQMSHSPNLAGGPG